MPPCATANDAVCPKLCEFSDVFLRCLRVETIFTVRGQCFVVCSFASRTQSWRKNWAFQPHARRVCGSRRLPGCRADFPAASDSGHIGSFFWSFDCRYGCWLPSHCFRPFILLVWLGYASSFPWYIINLPILYFGHEENTRKILSH